MKMNIKMKDWRATGKDWRYPDTLSRQHYGIKHLCHSVWLTIDCISAIFSSSVRRVGIERVPGGTPTRHEIAERCWHRATRCSNLSRMVCRIFL